MRYNYLFLLATATPMLLPSCVPGDVPSTCPDASVTYKAEPVGSDLHFLLDRSGSMHLDINDSDTRWSATKAALFSFLDRLEYRARATITMFPDGDAPVSCCPVTNPNCGACNESNVPGPQDRCNADSYLGGELDFMTPEHIDDLKAKVAASDKKHFWGTPLTAALGGVIRTVDTQSQAEHRAIVLLTDGKPTACESPGNPDANAIEHAIELARAAREQGTLTYVVGVVDGHPAADRGHMSAIAVAGGTARYPGCEDTQDCAYSVSVNTFEKDVNAALESIAIETTSCTYELPPQAGTSGTSEPMVSLRIGDDITAVPQDPDHTNGWDYLGDDRIRLYGDSCEALRLEPQASVEVSVGCVLSGN